MTKLTAKAKETFTRLLNGEPMTVSVKHGIAIITYKAMLDSHVLKTKFNYGGSGFGETTEKLMAEDELKNLVNSLYSSKSIKAYVFDPSPRF